MTDHLRNQITSFRQEDDEAMHEAWERYRDLFRRCPMHGLPEWTQVSIFYNSVNTSTRMMLDASANGTLLDKPPRESLEILDKLAQNDYQHPTSRRGTTRRGTVQLDSSDTILAQISALTNMVKNMQRQTNTQEVKALDAFCELCGNNHDTSECGQAVEPSCYVGNYNKNPRQNQQNLPRQEYQQPDNYKTLEKTLTQFMAQTSAYMARTDRFIQKTDAFMDRTEMKLQNHDATLKSLETQLGQISQILNTRPIGGFPSDTEVAKDEPAKAEEDHNDPTNTHTGESTAEPSHTKSDKLEKIRPPPPFPQRLKKQEQDYQFKKFFDILKQVHINLPLVEALQQMPNYAKFLKDMVSRKKRIEEFETAAATETCLALMHNKIPAKKTDPGYFTIECSMGHNYSTKALCDPGASINLMPKSVFQKLNIGEAKPTTVMLQLADHSFVQPEGKIEDILVQVDKFIFPADFLILNCDADENTPIILGRPFLATGENDPADMEDCQMIQATAEHNLNIENTCFSREHRSNLNNLGTDTAEIQTKTEIGNWVQTRPGKYFVPLNYTNEKCKTDKPSVEQPPRLELKTLPEQLKYAYLGTDSTLLVIISSKLQPAQEERLIKPLRQHKEALGWSIAVIKGISTTICMHKILLEDYHKPTVDAQRRLNQAMKDVVRKEILKWLDAGIIYPISDSEWVSPVQCVPKKGGITVISNENNELIPSRTVTGYNQIAIAPEDQSKTTFTCPYGTFAFRRMPFGLCNAPATCLSNLEKVLTRCEESNLVLNWEKCNFMVDEGIVLGHRISSRGMEVDRAKIEVISKLPPPTTVKGIRSFLGHAGFYRRFIENFSKITKPLCSLLEQGRKFEFDEACTKAFELLKNKLVTAPIVEPPDWTLPFELMCDASDYAVGAVLGQRKGKVFHPIYYASRTLNDAQVNYTTTEKELLAVIFAFDKFKSYLLGAKVTVYTDHSAIKYLLSKKDAKPRLIRWILLLQEFDVEIIDKKGTGNQVADHLSRLENKELTTTTLEIKETFPDEQL
ncbi:hypothetical protein V6N13_061325 [Hibiscus sabdariffa]